MTVTAQRVQVLSTDTLWARVLSLPTPLSFILCLSACLYISSCYSHARTVFFDGFFCSSVVLTLALPYIFTSTHSESNLCVNCNRRLHCCRHRHRHRHHHHHRHDNADDDDDDNDVVPVLCWKQIASILLPTSLSAIWSIFKLLPH